MTLDDGAIVHVWREAVAKKYSKMPNLHDFVFSKHCVTGEVVARTCMPCYSGQFSHATMHILAGQNRTESIIADETQTYTELGKKRSLSESKMSQMYQNFIPAERWLEFVS